MTNRVKSLQKLCICLFRHQIIAQENTFFSVFTESVDSEMPRKSTDSPIVVRNESPRASPAMPSRFVSEVAKGLTDIAPAPVAQSQIAC